MNIYDSCYVFLDTREGAQIKETESYPYLLRETSLKKLQGDLRRTHGKDAVLGDWFSLPDRIETSTFSVTRYENNFEMIGEVNKATILFKEPVEKAKPNPLIPFTKELANYLVKNNATFGAMGLNFRIALEGNNLLNVISLPSAVQDRNGFTPKNLSFSIGFQKEITLTFNCIQKTQGTIFEVNAHKAIDTQNRSKEAANFIGYYHDIVSCAVEVINECGI